MNGVGIRERFGAVVQRAAEAGFPNPSRLFTMTPREIEWTLTAFAAQQRMEMERLDAAAWLIGRYCAVGWHAPRRYPKKPDGVRRARPTMSDAEIRAVFEKMAKEGENERV